MGVVFLCQAEDGIRDLVRSRGLGDVYKRQVPHLPEPAHQLGLGRRRHLHHRHAHRRLARPREGPGAGTEAGYCGGGGLMQPWGGIMKVREIIRCRRGGTTGERPRLFATVVVRRLSRPCSSLFESLEGVHSTPSKTADCLGVPGVPWVPGVPLVTREILSIPVISPISSP